MERCGAKTKDLFVGKEHVCGLPADPLGTGEPCRVHACKKREGWGECGFGWIEGVERTKHSDFGSRLEGADCSQGPRRGDESEGAIAEGTLTQLSVHIRYNAEPEKSLQ